MLFKSKNTPKPQEIEDEVEGLRTIEVPDMGRCLRELQLILDEKRPKGAVLRLYLENFKQFNDTFGHDFGELFLHEIFAYLGSLRSCFTMRCGGAEFLVVLDGMNFSQATEIARHIQDRFEGTWRINEMDYMCAMSLGMVFYPEEGDNAAELVSHLGYAVTEASRKAQNALAIFNSELRQKMERRSAIAKLIPEALRSNAIDVRYRPTIDMKTGKFTRAECYLRLFSPDFGIIGSAEFVPIAEDSGQICAINNYAIHATCRDIRRLMDANIAFETLAVPLSPIQFLQESFMEDMQGILKKYGIQPHKLAFEISESVLVNSLGRVYTTMQELNEMGVEFIINEFGTGYSGINNILDLPVEVLKLERMFVWQLETNPDSGVLIEGLISIAHKLGLKLIAEGVETENQVKLLEQYGCGYEQGFYYSPTVSPQGLLELMGHGTEAVQGERGRYEKDKKD